MSKLNIWRISPLLRLVLAVTLDLAFLMGLLLTMSATRLPDVAQAQVSTTTGEADPTVPLEIRLNAGTDGAYSIDYIRAAPNMLTVIKQANPDPVQAGSPLTYTIRLTNTGDITLTATITDIPSRQVAPNCVLTWTSNPIAPGGVWTQQFTVTVKTGYSGTLTNVVQVAPEEGVTSVYTETSTAQVLTQGSFTTAVVITPTAISHEISGTGVHIFDSDYHSPAFTSTLDALGLEYLRVPFGPEWNKLDNTPPVCNDETYTEARELMYTFVMSNFNGDFPDRLTNATSISNIAQNLGIEIIFLNWRAHKNWLTDPTYKELKEEYVDDYACFVTQIVKFLTDQGVKISYLEPTNEPSDTSDTKIPPKLYSTFVALVRKYLDVEGLSKVEILGPGLAYLNHDGTGEGYVEDLDEDGVNAISVWASHAWDPEFCFHVLPEKDVLGIRCKEFQKAIAERDPSKPFFITEYACVNDPGNEICAVENTLTLLDCGANGVIYWYLREQEWDEKQANRERALLTETYAKKPMFTALTSVFPFISGDEVGVLETQVEGRITAASFYTADNKLTKEQIIVVLVNSEPVLSESVSIDILDTVEVAHRVVYDGNTKTVENRDLGSVQCQAHDDRTRCELSVQPDTITTLVFNVPIIVTGPTTGLLNTPYTFTATVNPITVTLPITYIWQATGQDKPTTHTNGLSDTVTFTWSTTGTQTITVMAMNAINAVSAVHHIAITPPPVPPDSVTINGPDEGEVGKSSAFSADVKPDTTTPPITYTWQATGQTDVVTATDATSHSVSYTWDTAGVQTITVIARNAVGVVSAVHHITFTVPPPVPPHSVTINGPGEGELYTTYRFTATADSPTGTVTLPLTFVWQATDRLSVTHVSDVGASDVVTFTWSLTGTKGITVTATNAGGSTSNTHSIDIVPLYVYLPVVLKNTD
jgi:uncharacterized repeat protein (TIGR01451 family)